MSQTGKPEFIVILKMENNVNYFQIQHASYLIKQNAKVLYNALFKEINNATKI